MKSPLYIIYGHVLSLQNENPGVSEVRIHGGDQFPFSSLLEYFCDWDYKSIEKVKSSLPRPGRDETSHSFSVRPKNNNEKINKHTVSR